MIKRYNITQLSKATGIGRDTLTRWKNIGWLITSCRVGSRYYYSESDFLVAEEKSLEGDRNAQQDNNIDWAALERIIYEN